MDASFAVVVPAGMLFRALEPWVARADGDVTTQARAQDVRDGVVFHLDRFDEHLITARGDFHLVEEENAVRSDQAFRELHTGVQDAGVFGHVRLLQDPSALTRRNDGGEVVSEFQERTIAVPEAVFRGRDRVVARTHDLDGRRQNALVEHLHESHRFARPTSQADLPAVRDHVTGRLRLEGRGEECDDEPDAHDDGPHGTSFVVVYV